MGPRAGPDRLSETAGRLREAFTDHLERGVLGFWERAVDPVAGGFYTDLDRRGRPRGPQERFLVHVARLLWSFSAAHRAGFGDGRYLGFADRAASSLDAFWDGRHGAGTRPSSVMAK